MEKLNHVAAVEFKERRVKAQAVEDPSFCKNGQGGDSHLSFDTPQLLRKITFFGSF